MMQKEEYLARVTSHEADNSSSNKKSIFSTKFLFGKKKEKGKIHSFKHFLI